MTAWQALSGALATATPPCAGDDRFTSDSNEHDPALRQLCAGCPIREQCREYGKTAPRGRAWGFYGGVVRRVMPQARTRAREAAT